MLLSARPLAAQTSADFEIDWTWTLTPLGESWPAFKLLVENAEPCRLPPGVEGPDDAGNGIRVRFDGTVVYETGAPNVTSEFEGVENISLVTYYGPANFMVDSEVLELPRAAAPATVEVECRSDDGSWVSVVNQQVVVPAIEDFFRLLPVQDFQDPDRFFVLYFETFIENEPPFPGESDVTVSIDGTPAPLQFNPEFFAWSGEIPETAREPGRHTVSITLGGRTEDRAFILGYNPNPIETAETTISTTTVPDSTTTATPAPPTTETPTTTEAEPPPDPDDDEVAGQALPLLPQVDDLDFSPADAVQTALATVMVVLLIGFQSDLVNKTIEENTGRFFVPLIGGQFDASPLVRLRRLLASLTPWQATKRILAPRRQQVAFVAVVLGLALAGYAADADRSLQPGELEASLLLGDAAAIAITALAFALTEEAFKRRLGKQPGEFKLLTWTLVPALILLLLSRIADFDPPYVYGLVAGFMTKTTTTEESTTPRREALPVVAAAVALLATSFIGFIGYTAINPEQPTFASQTLGGLFVVGVQGLLFGLVPLRFMDGAQIWNWNRKTWAAIYAVVVAAFVYLMVFNNPQPTEVEDGADATSAITEAAILFIAFAILSLGFWAWFRLRPTTAVQALADSGPAETTQPKTLERTSDEATASQAAELQCVGRSRSGDGELTSLTYRSGEEEVEIPIDELVTQAAEGRLPGHLRRRFQLVTTESKAAPDSQPEPTSLEVVAIRRNESAVTDLKFSTGLDLTVAETARLQQANIVKVEGLQLIAPEGGTPYYRTPANSTADDNLENYPTFDSP